MTGPVTVPVGPLEAVATDQVTAARATWSAFRRNPLGLISVGILAALLIVGTCAPLIAGFPSGYGDQVLQGPSGAHWFGTDNLGRDIFAEVIWGARISIVVAALSSALAIVLGVVIAVLGAYFPKADTVIGTFVDLCLSLPVLPLMILVAALAGPSLVTLVLVIAFFSWPEVTRVVRSQALSVVRLPYMDAARLTGGSHVWIIRKHLLPAVAPVVVVSVVLTASRAVISAAGLAFLGLGDPNSWSWGRILYEAEQSGAMSSAWWTTLFPSLAMLALVVSATLISIAYNDARNPRTRED
jgi:peptide/nickel transport system permease protein